MLSRRAFTGGALSLAASSAISTPASAQVDAALAAALAAIQSFAIADLALNHLPGLTLGLITPDGRKTVLNFGYANADARTSIGPNTLFQIGSISKVMVATVIHQLAAEGRLRLTDRISALLADVPLPPGNMVEVQHLLDHVAGLPDDAPLFTSGGLWTAYAPGAHWHYSNTGYEILGKLVEHATGDPLARALHERIFAPLAMSRSRGAIIDSDRLLYAQGYEPADRLAAYVRGVPLAPAPWVDVTAGAGCVASTADDMLTFLQVLGSAVQGRGALRLSPEQAVAMTTHAVPSDMGAMRYGNGLMHVADNGRRYLHHTGGMISFSSSFHLDVGSGAGAFASSTISAFADYRPRLLTQFAADALTNAAAGLPLPVPPALDVGLPNAGSYLGRYSGPSGTFEVRAGAPLSIVAQGQTARLLPVAEDIFRTAHPAFRQYSFLFERSAGAVSMASWGANSFARDGAGASLRTSDPALARLAGRYINDNPWYGPMPVVERGGRLWIGTETPMTRITDNEWRVGREEWSPERGSFADFIDGRPQTFVFSGVKFPRHEV